MDKTALINSGWVENPDGTMSKKPTAELRKMIEQSMIPSIGVSEMERRLNKTEQRFLAVLRSRINIQKCTGYFNIGIQSVTLRLGFDLRYTPDFVTTEGPMGGQSVTFWEVKGAFEREDAKVKIKVAAAMFPYWTFIKAVWKDGAWTETVVRS